MSIPAIPSSALKHLALSGAFTGHSPEDAEEAIARNVDVISSVEQVALCTSRLLVAGCGSVGGSVVDPLVRLGLGSVVLADPESFELSNLNRQACFLADVGRSKARVLSERGLAINPQLETRVFEEGLNDDNLRDAMRGVNVVFDGIDAGMSPWEKYALHELACAEHIPVLSGIDFGGKAVIYVFDYRERAARPFFGKASAEAHRERRFADCLKWLGYSHFPADFLPVIRDRMDSGEPWPQVSYCVQAMGAIGTRTILDVVMGRKVPKVVAFDTHMKARPVTGRVSEYLRLPVRLLDTYLAVKRRGPGARNGRSETAQVTALLSTHSELARVVAAVGRAPSPHNCQPWLLHLRSATELGLGWNPSRALPIVDSRSHAMAYSLGCAVEAAATIADIEWLPSGAVDMQDPEYRAGTIRIHGLKQEGFARRSALLEARSTNRYPYFVGGVHEGLSARLADLLEPLGVHAVLAQPNRRTLRRLTRAGAERFFGQPGYVEELLAHYRVSGSEAGKEATGMSADGLALDWWRSKSMKLLRDNASLRGLASTVGAPRLMAAAAAANVESSGGFLLLTTRDTTTNGRVDAGRALMRAWLELTREQLACQPLDFPISFEEGRRRVLELFSRSAEEHPVALLRVGRPTRASVSRSARLPVTEICRADPALARRAESEPVRREALR